MPNEQSLRARHEAVMHRTTTVLGWNHAGSVVLLFLLSVGWALDLDAQTPTFDGPLRAVHIAGNWGANRHHASTAWDPDGTEPLIPHDYIEHLQDLHVDWIGISVALHYEDSMDSTVERAYSSDLDVPTFSDEALRQLIHEFREHGFNVYLTLAFESHEAYAADRPAQRSQLGDPGHPDTGVPPDDPEFVPPILPENWPWRPSHRDHRRFVREFWATYTEQAVHFARIAQEEGVGMYSLGTETDRLFRTRSAGYYWTNDFGQELEAMVDSVRTVYDGLLTYDMHYSAITSDFFEAGSRFLWQDLDLDVVGVSAWFPLVETPPSTVMSVEGLRQAYERIFREHVLPLRAAGRPIVFLEYGITDTVGAPAKPGDAGPQYRREPVTYSDMNGNGLDDGQETQANVFEALFETMDRYAGSVYGAFFWDNWIADHETWSEHYAIHRTFSFRDKLAEDVVRAHYDGFRPVEWLPIVALDVGDEPFVVSVTGRLPVASSYVATSSTPDVATVRVSGSDVTVVPVAEGVATVTVNAPGTDGSAAALRFTVRVRDLRTERAALETLYRVTGGESWTDNTNWLSDAALKDWYGVGLNGDDRVAQLRLGGWDDALQRQVGNGLTGPLPSELGALTYLKELSLAGNQLTGSIPAELGGLGNLRELALGGNALTGSIPAELGNLTSLVSLNIGGNALSGPIPATLANLTNLERLTLWGRGWTSKPAPEWLGRLTNLRSVDLGGHRLAGPIPAAWEKLGNLERLYLWGNALTGPIPTWFGGLARLRNLNLVGNPLTGPIPWELGNLTGLRELSLGLTSLTGPIPASLTRLADLSRFDIAGTAVCVPDDPALQAWLAGIRDFSSSEIACEESPASVTVAFGSAAYTVTEGGSVNVPVQLSEALTPARPVSIGLTATPGRGATTSDYSVPASVAFARGKARAIIDVVALRDAERDGGETITMAFRALPAGVTAGPPSTATVTILDATDDGRTFTDHPIRPGVTPLRAVHFRELRTRIAALRAREGLPPVQWTDPVLRVGITPVKRLHVAELRAALDAVYDAGGRPRPIYTGAVLTAGVSIIEAAHVMELRTAILALE